MIFYSVEFEFEHDRIKSSNMSLNICNFDEFRETSPSLAKRRKMGVFERFCHLLTPSDFSLPYSTLKNKFKLVLMQR